MTVGETEKTLKIWNPPNCYFTSMEDARGELAAP